MIDKVAISFLIVALATTFTLPLLTSEQQLPFDSKRPETNFTTDFIEGRGIKVRIIRHKVAPEGSLYFLRLDLWEDSEVDKISYVVLFDLEERGGTRFAQIQGSLVRPSSIELTFPVPQVERNTNAVLTIGLIRSSQEPRENMVLEEFTVPIMNRFSIADGLVSAYQLLIIGLWTAFITYSMTRLLKRALRIYVRGAQAI